MAGLITAQQADEQLNAKSTDSLLTLNVKSLYPEKVAQDFLNAHNHLVATVGRQYGLEHLYVDEKSFDKNTLYKQLEGFNKELTQYINQKAVTGAGASTGSGLVSQTYEPLDQILSIAGGAFLDSGVPLVRNQVGTMNVPGVSNPGHYGKAASSGTPVTNDATSGNPFFNAQEPLYRYSLAVPFYSNPVLANYTGNLGQLFGLFMAYLEQEKLVLTDTIFARRVTTNSNVQVQADTGNTYAPIASAAQDALTSKLGKYSYKKSLYFNHNGFFRFLNERNALGDFPQLSNKFAFATVDQSVPAKGKVGTFCGADVFIVPNDGTTGIRNDYQVNSNGLIQTTTDTDNEVINATTGGIGGNKTCFIAGIPLFGKLGRCRPELDIITEFNEQNTLSVAQTGVPYLFGITQMAGAISNPTAYVYYTF